MLAQTDTIQSAKPSPALATPAALSYASSNASVEVIQPSGQLRQLKAPQALTDIVTLDAFSYEIRYYLPGQAGTFSGGLYHPSGSPFVTWKIQNPDASLSSFNTLRITETRGSDVKTYESSYTDATQLWNIGYPGGLKQETLTVSIVTNGTSVSFPGHNLPGYLRTVTNTVSIPGGAIQSQIKRVYRRFYWGEALVEETLNPAGANPQTTTLTYYDGGAYGAPGFTPTGTKIPLQQIVHPDGSWEYYIYDGLGRKTDIYYGTADAPPSGPGVTPDASTSRRITYSYNPFDAGDHGTLYPDQPRSITEMLNAYTVSQRFFLPLPGEIHDMRGQRPESNHYDADNLITITRFFTSGPNLNRVKSIENPDGTMSFFDYTNSVDGYQTNTVWAGQPNSGKTAILAGSETISVTGPLGEQVSRIATDVASTAVTGSETYGNYDDFNRPQRITFLDGTHEDTHFACCYVDYTTNRDGVMTQYTYDALKRQIASATLGITASNMLDAAGHLLKTIRIGTDSSQIVMGQSYPSGRAPMHKPKLGPVLINPEV